PRHQRAEPVVAALPSDRRAAANPPLLQCLSAMRSQVGGLPLSQSIVGRRWRAAAMLVIDEATAVAYSEQRVIDWMRTWSGQWIIVGLALRVGSGEHTDLVVLTPRATIVMDVEGTVPDARDGVLSVRPDGRWKLSGYEGDPLGENETP